MIRTLLILLVAALAIFFGPIASGNKGYVLINMADWTIKMSVVSLVISLATLFFGFWFIEWVLHKLLRVSNSSLLWLSNRKQRKALQQTHDGLLAVAAQDWKSAENLLTKSARNSHTPELNYLIAAEAAKQQGKSKQQEKYVEKIENKASATLAVAMTKARLADDTKSREEAKAELELWLQKQPKNPALLIQLAHLYQALELWGDWLKLEPALRKYTAMDESQLDTLLISTYRAHFNALLKQEGVEAVFERWNALPKEHHKQTQIRAAYYQSLIQAGYGKRIESELFEQLNKAPLQPLLDLWRTLEIEQPEERLLKVKKHNSRRTDYASFLGLTALHAKRWDEAIHYLQLALEHNVTQRDQLALAQALEFSGQQQKALEVYKKLADVLFK